ncbi:flagellar basal body protein FliL [Geovibrio thiophilus]|uniref:Flagellar protein FliL n=1 Tax=Geovibrio thiophilus TaxID=139438 RepID=A0A410JW04_9BACT|nr:flagellar basal body-associated FliL family protein [Geovibrio thiophilus]QAR32387.1 flagellar basal body protein FliL [Geovibrio thiophilus]
MAADEKDTQPEQGGKKKSKLKLIIIILLLLVLLGGGGAAYFLFLKPNPNQAAQPAAAASAAPEAAPSEAIAQIGELYPLESFVVNLADPGGTRYLRVTLQIELTAVKGLKEEIDKRVPQIRDAIITILSSKRYEEINSAQGKMIMKQQIMRRINSLLAAGQIANVYVTEFVIQ